MAQEAAPESVIDQEIEILLLDDQIGREAPDGLAHFGVEAGAQRADVRLPEVLRWQ
jgi:hypothetical protein